MQTKLDTGLLETYMKEAKQQILSKIELKDNGSCSTEKPNFWQRWYN